MPSWTKLAEGWTKFMEGAYAWWEKLAPKAKAATRASAGAASAGAGRAAGTGVKGVVVRNATRAGQAVKRGGTKVKQVAHNTKQSVQIARRVAKRKPTTDADGFSQFDVYGLVDKPYFDKRLAVDLNVREAQETVARAGEAVNNKSSGFLIPGSMANELARVERLLAGKLPNSMEELVPFEKANLSAYRDILKAELKAKK